MIRCLLFDLDGTLGNTLPLCIAAFKKAIEPLAGKTLSDEEIIETFGPSEEGVVQALIPEHYEQGMAEYLRHYRELHGMCAAPFEGIVNVLDIARERKLRLALVTGKGAKSAEISLEVFGMGSYFEVIETGSPEGPRKVQGIQNAMAELGVAPEESLYVGDSPSDIEHAREAGVRAVAAAWAETADPERLRTLHPDRLFTTVEEFIAYLRQEA
ncbi:HAD family hydrolase [Gorillibacterium sp. sgz500922]|uniref:HAD family hydrolase n=1 Tax=Gorillibacterium sp. sgz500922 TaxID=3446694 RepID=UPI003F67FB55